MSFWNQLVDRFRGGAEEEIDGEALRMEPDLGVRLGTEWGPGGEAGSVAVRALLGSQESKADLLIIDTAGRQANKRNLLLELEKIKRSLQKKSAGVPHHTWLVAGGMTGSGVLQQAREFHGAIGLTGLIVTKLDGSARGGMVPAVRAEVGLPTYYLGRGEKPEDLKRFNAAEFTEGFFGD